MCAMILGAFFEAVSIGVVIPFIAVLKEPDLLFKARHTGPLLSHLNISDPRNLFFILGPALIALFAIKTGSLIQLYRWLFRYSLYRDPEVLVIDEGTANLGPSSLSDLAGLGRIFALIRPFFLTGWHAFAQFPHD